MIVTAVSEAQMLREAASQRDTAELLETYLEGL